MMQHTPGTRRHNGAIVKFNLHLLPRQLDRITRLAGRSNQSMSSIIRTLIDLGLYVLDELDAGDAGAAAATIDRANVARRKASA